MKNLFLGLLFLTIDFKIGLGRISINILPDFAGYLLLSKGFEEMKGQSARFASVQPWTTALAVYSGVLFGAELLGITFGSRIVMWALNLGAMAAGFYGSRVLVLGIGDLEQANNLDLGSGRLKVIWLYWAILEGIRQLIRWIPLVGNVAAVAAIILALAFLAAFYKTKNAWERRSVS